MDPNQPNPDATPVDDPPADVFSTDARPPDATEVVRFAGEAVHTLKSVREQLRRDTEKLQAERGRVDTDRTQIKQQQEKLAQQRKALETEWGRLFRAY